MKQRHEITVTLYVDIETDINITPEGAFNLAKQKLKEQLQMPFDDLDIYVSTKNVEI